MPDVLLIKTHGFGKTLGYMHRDKLPEGDLPETIVVGGKVFLYLEDDGAADDSERTFLASMKFAGLPVVGRYAEIGALNFDAQRGTHFDRPSTSPIVWLEGCAPIGEPEKPEAG